MSPLEDSSLLPPPDASPAREREYMVVARRYRPQAFDQLVGQQHVAQALSGAITSNRVGHAYLFTGARGVGKTSAARILAKALNCIHGPTPTPCNQCEICLGISSGDDVDVLEIDGASNRGIDEMRELRQNVNIRPSRARFKIYIIDEVHMLTREAFNALLKTLEEPPEHVKFIFCTTEPEKIPVTILSRCQKFDFAGIQSGSISERLRQIVEAEGVEAEPAALEALARRAAGSMRDSQSLLEQLLAFGGPRITLDDVHRMLGTAGDHRLSLIAGHLVDRNAAGALTELDQALAEGVDIGPLLDQLLGYFRDMLISAVGCPAEAMLYASASEQPAILEAGRKLGLETLLAVMQIVDQTLARLRYSTHGRILAELALVRICKLADLEQLGELIGQVRQGIAPIVSPGTHSGGGLAGSATQREQASRPSSASSTEAAKKKRDAIAERDSSTEASGSPSISERASREGRSAGSPESSSEHDAVGPSVPSDQVSDASSILSMPGDIDQIWRQVLSQLSDMLAESAACCQRVANSAPNRVVVTFPSRYTFSKTFCERPEQLLKLEKAFQDVTGGPVRVEFALSDDEPEDAQPASSKQRLATPRQRLMEKAEHPLVRRAAELFEARPVRVEEEPETAS